MDRLISTISTSCRQSRTRRYVNRENIKFFFYEENVTEASNKQATIIITPEQFATVAATKC